MTTTGSQDRTLNKERALWVRTTDQLPPDEKLVLGDDGSGVFLVTLSGDHWRYSGFESQAGPLFWCVIPKRMALDAKPLQCGHTTCDKDAQPGDTLCHAHRKAVDFSQIYGTSGRGLSAGPVEEIAQKLFVTLGLVPCGGTDDKGQWKDDWVAKSAIRQAFEEVYKLAVKEHKVMDYRMVKVMARLPEILKDLGISKVRLLSNNPHKVKSLKQAGLKTVERVPLEISPRLSTARYLKTKKEKMGHLLLKV